MKKSIFLLFLLLLLTGCAGRQETKIEIAGDFSCYMNLPQSGTWNLCPAMDTQIYYMLLSREPMEKNAGVYTDISGVCEYSLSEISVEEHTEFPLWLYQTYRGMDWNNATGAETMYLEDYEKMKTEGFPSLYGYWVENKFTADTLWLADRAARYKSLDFTVGNRNYTQSVSTLEVSGDIATVVSDFGTYEEIYGWRLTNVTAPYWGDGVITLPPIRIPAEDAVQELSAAALYGISGEIIKICVEMGGKTQIWDGSSVLSVPAGCTTTLTITLQTEVNQIIGYCEDANIAVCRTVGKLHQRLWYFASIGQSWNIYELYATVVDGMDLSAYYSHAAGWKKPQNDLVPEAEQIAFKPISAVTRGNCKLCVTGLFQDAFGLTVELEVENEADTPVELCLGDVHINDCYLRTNHALPLAADEKNAFYWCIPWETMQVDGIHVGYAQALSSIEFTVNPLYDGMLPEDAAGRPIYNDELICISLSETAQSFVGSDPALKTGTLRFLNLQFTKQHSNTLTAIPHADAFCLYFYAENISSELVSFSADHFQINGIAVEGIAVGTILGNKYCFCTVPFDLTDTQNRKIGTPETVSFEITVNGSEVFTVTVDYSEDTICGNESYIHFSGSQS